jgi:hypothetical protein
VVALIRLVSLNTNTAVIQQRLRWKSDAHIEYMRNCRASETTLLLPEEIDADEEDLIWDEDPEEEFIHPV